MSDYDLRASIMCHDIIQHVNVKLRIITSPFFQQEGGFFE